MFFIYYILFSLFVAILLELLLRCSSTAQGLYIRFNIDVITGTCSKEESKRAYEQNGFNGEGYLLGGLWPIIFVIYLIAGVVKAICFSVNSFGKSIDLVEKFIKNKQNGRH